MRRTTTTKIFCLLSQHCQRILFETSLVAPSSPETFQSPTTVSAPSTASSTAFISPSPHECKDDVQDPAVCNYPHICSNAYVQKVCRKSCGLCKSLFVFFPLITIIISSSLPCLSSVRAAICRPQLCAKMFIQTTLLISFISLHKYFKLTGKHHANCSKPYTSGKNDGKFWILNTTCQ